MNFSIELVVYKLTIKKRLMHEMIICMINEVYSDRYSNVYVLSIMKILKLHLYVVQIEPIAFLAFF